MLLYILQISHNIPPFVAAGAFIEWIAVQEAVMQAGIEPLLLAVTVWTSEMRLEGVEGRGLSTT